jgi:hypothetical protein
VRQQVGQRNASHAEQQPGAYQAGGGSQVQRAAHDRGKQQHREQEEVDEALDLLPDRAVQGGVAADEESAEDEGEIGKQQLKKIHGAQATMRACAFPIENRRVE